MGKQKILIVDDSPINREILVSMLEDLYEITEAENGSQAVQILEKQGDDFSLVLLDLVMPEIDGFGVLTYMNKAHWTDSLPVIIISAETAHDRVVRAYELGAADFVSRPFDAYIVRQRIKNALMMSEKQKKLTDIAADEIYERLRSYDRMLSILSQIVEFRSQESGTHVLHIRQVVELFARQLMGKTDKYGLTLADVTMIGMLSSLHDIGKITIPDAILNKPGKLTPEEYAVMQTHAAAGAYMMKGLPEFGDDPMLSMAYDICRWHHERYDGKGYPDGLCGDDIPIAAQIVSIADVYDALTGKRCYKQTYSPKQATEMILNGECGVFNPLLLDCLKELADNLAKLQTDTLKERRQNNFSRLSTELSQHGELSVSNRLLGELRFERARAEFFESKSDKMTFVYKCNPSMLILSPATAKRLGLKEVTPKPDSDEQLAASSGLSRRDWLTRQESISPQSPDFVLHGVFKVDGVKQHCRCDCRSIWSKEDVPKYLGAVGTIAVSDT